MLARRRPDVRFRSVRPPRLEPAESPSRMCGSSRSLLDAKMWPVVVCAVTPRMGIAMPFNDCAHHLTVLVQVPDKRFVSIWIRRLRTIRRTGGRASRRVWSVPTADPSLVRDDNNKSMDDGTRYVVSV